MLKNDKPDRSHVKKWVVLVCVFLFGCAMVILPAFYRASVVHADETARGEQTMGPGIQMFMGLIFAPLGGLVALGVWYAIRHWRRTS